MKSDQFNSYHLSENAKIVTATVPGPKSKELIEFQKEREASVVSYPRKMPLAINRAKGAIIEDVDGNHFIDFFGGCGVVNVGHSNPEVVLAVNEQIESLVHALDFPTENKKSYIEKIFAQLPADIRDEYKILFCAPTGSDAIEAAIKLAKHRTGRTGVIAFQGAYHGMTSGALAVTSDLFFRRKYGSLIPDVHFVPYSYCYRCSFGQEKKSCAMECASYLENVISNPHSGVTKPAAIILESVQGEGGIIAPKDGYLKRVIELARENDITVIFDEVQSGFFRTGPFLALQEENCWPDIITLSKGLGGIGLPLAAILYRKDIETWSVGAHIGTFRGNQAGIAGGNAAMDFAVANDLSTHVKEMGEFLQEELRDIAKDIPFIGEVRGKGLFIGVEYVKDKTTKEPYPDFIPMVRNKALQLGLLFEVGGHYGNVIRFTPPLIITKTIAINAMKIFRRANQEVLAELSVAETATQNGTQATAAVSSSSKY